VSKSKNFSDLNKALVKVVSITFEPRSTHAIIIFQQYLLTIVVVKI